MLKKIKKTRDKFEVLFPLIAGCLWTFVAITENNTITYILCLFFILVSINVSRKIYLLILERQRLDERMQDLFKEFENKIGGE